LQETKGATRLTELAKTYTRDMALRFPLMPGSHEIAWRYMFDWAICGEALDCAPGDLVLEFAAGPSYASELLNRLGYRTVALDIDPEILSFARERLTLDQRLDAKRAEFVCGDGQHLPFHDASIDGVITLNALHHMPDYRAALAEIRRILKPGARAVFSEPGSKHADAPESRVAVEQYGAVEKSIHLDELYRLARELGFEHMILKPFVHPGLVELDYREFSRYRLNASSARLTRPDQIARYFVNQHTIFVLTVPGRRPLTSARAGVEDGLRADIRIVDVTGSTAPGEPVSFRAIVKNSGSHIWLSEQREFGGHVVMGIKLCRTDGRMIMSLPSTLLHQDVAPGEAVNIERCFLLPWLEPASYLIKFDMVAEQVGWFEQFGSKAVTRDLNVLPGRLTSACPKVLHAEIAVAGLPEVARPGDEISLTATVRNSGDTLWLSQPREYGGQVAMGINLCRIDGQLVKEFSSLLLHEDIVPGEAVEIERRFLLPWLEPGSYLIKFDMVAEQVGWFEQFGSPIFAHELKVLPGPVTSACPKLLWAEIDVAGVPDAARPGDPIELVAKVRNCGDTLWLSQPPEGGGRVVFAIKFCLPDSGDPKVLRQVLLPHDVKQGEEIIISNRFLLPWLEEGLYEMKFDLLSEKVGWFQEFGSTIDIRPLMVLPGPVNSACPKTLCAEIAVVGLPEVARPGDPMKLVAKVRNCGDTLWLSQPRECGGYVALGVKFSLPDNRIAKTLPYLLLPHDVSPGEEIVIEKRFTLPWLEEAFYEITIDMVAENVGWFQEFGSTIAVEPLRVLTGPVTSACPKLLLAEIAVAGLPRGARAGDEITVRATVRNIGDTLWLSALHEFGGYVTFGVKLIAPDGQLVSESLGRANLPYDIAPDERGEIESTFRLPWTLDPGTYLLRFDMVDEQIVWFGQFGSLIVERKLTVEHDHALAHGLSQE
jgi:ubiquinone/menaquinone biosynthesis C-methylase UbiE